MPKVSVLLTTYNRPHMLAEAAASVLTQTYGDYELIILDDNSGDPAQWDILMALRDEPRVRLYKDDVQPGERDARVRYAVLANIGLALARGEYVTYLCDDDLYLPRRLQVMTARLDEGDCQVVYGSQRCERDGRVVLERPAAGVLARASMVVDHSSVMHTRAAGLAAGGWDEDPAHWRAADAVFWDRLTAAGHLFHPVSEFTDVHRFHAGSVSEAGIPA
jgi:spore maturation protein CgeD